MQSTNFAKRTDSYSRPPPSYSHWGTAKVMAEERRHPCVVLNHIDGSRRVRAVVAGIHGRHRTMGLPSGPFPNHQCAIRRKNNYISLSTESIEPWPSKKTQTTAGDIIGDKPHWRRHEWPFTFLLWRRQILVWCPHPDRDVITDWGKRKM